MAKNIFVGKAQHAVGKKTGKTSPSPKAASDQSQIGTYPEASPTLKEASRPNSPERVAGAAMDAEGTQHYAPVSDPPPNPAAPVPASKG